MTKAKRNTVVGFRTAWSMYNDNTWRKVTVLEPSVLLLQEY